MPRILMVLLALWLLMALPCSGADPLSKGLPGEIKNEAWNKLREKFTGNGQQSECCEPHMAKKLCKSGCKMTGYVQVINRKVRESWDKSSPGPQGYVALAGRTLSKEGAVCCDEIKASICEP